MKRRSRLTALVVLIIVLAVGGYLTYQSRRAASRPPVVEHEVIGATRGISPAPEFLLRHQGELQLTSAQQARIGQIATQYRRDVAPTQAKLETASREYQQYLTQMGGKRPSAQDLAERGAEVSRLSGAIAVARHSYWQQARAALTPQQQTKADKLAASATLRAKSRPRGACASSDSRYSSAP